MTNGKVLVLATFLELDNYQSLGLHGRGEWSFSWRACIPLLLEAGSSSWMGGRTTAFRELQFSFSEDEAYLVYDNHSSSSHFSILLFGLRPPPLPIATASRRWCASDRISSPTASKAGETSSSSTKRNACFHLKRQSLEVARPSPRGSKPSCFLATLAEAGL